MLVCDYRHQLFRILFLAIISSIVNFIFHPPNIANLLQDHYICVLNYHSHFISIEDY